MYETRWSRRRFIATGAVAAAAAGMPATLRAQTAKYTRYDLASAEGKRMLKGYAAAVKAMHALPPEDPCNWYRITIIHTLDCPHGNWWFLPWHRGYVGYLEQIVRKYSGMADFAFPYWDWTAQPRVPADFFGADNPLDPLSSIYIKKYADFKAKFEKPVANLYAGFSAGQKQQLGYRDFETTEQLWKYIDPAYPPHGFFYPDSTARCLTAQSPEFASPPGGCEGCKSMPDAVSKETITNALKPTIFTVFGSGIAEHHSGSASQGLLESQPHNQVHNCTGGFMSDLMSPVDPLFFMHHSNIERLWLIWTQKQESIGKPTLPEGAEKDKWWKEPFLFYVDEKCQPLSKVAGDFATVGSFDYTYTKGTGANLATAPKSRVAEQYFAASSAVPDDLVKRSAASEDGPDIFAEVPIDPGAHQKGKSFHILLNPPADLDPADTSSPHHVATVSFFGSGHGHGHGPVNFVVSLSKALRALTKAGLFKAGTKIRLVVATDEGQHDAGAKVKVKLAVKPVEAKIHVF